MSDAERIPQAMRWQTLIVIVAVALIALIIGAAFAGPLRAGLAEAGARLGFGSAGPRESTSAPRSSGSGTSVPRSTGSATKQPTGHDHEDELVAVTDESGEVQYYTCGMHPWVILPKPGDCPICHMELTPIDPDKFTGEIVIDPVIVQNMGVRVAPVVTGPLTKTIRTVGTIRHAESAMIEINPRYAGWIETLHVEYEGQHVMAGQPLFEVFSPKLYAAKQELIVAGDDSNLVEAARQRLLNLGVRERDIQSLMASGDAGRTVTIHSPIAGHVVRKQVVEGAYIEPGDTLYRIADHSRVWIDITIYEQQIPLVELGMKATITVPSVPGEVFEADVIYIAPHLHMQSRQLDVRVEVPTPDHLLKPGMFANVTLQNTLAAEKTLAPRSAVIDTGVRQVAFVSRGEGKFEPRDVRLGIETGDGMVEIISGLSPGEMVVTSGQFLIDSEAKMREALGKMIAGEPAVERPKPTRTSDSGPALRRPAENEKLTPYPLEVCLVTDAPLDSMGGAVRYAYGDREILFCCEGCPPAFNSDPQRYLDKLREQIGDDHDDERKAAP